VSQSRRDGITAARKTTWAAELAAALAARGWYAAEADPVGRADVVIGNDDVAAPVLRRIGATAAG
jgi:hypothetical protein